MTARAVSNKPELGPVEVPSVVGNAMGRKYTLRSDINNLTPEAAFDRWGDLPPPARQAAESPRSGPQSTADSGPVRASDSIHVKNYVSPGWFDAVSVAKKRKLIEAKGLPDFHNWRFITLTCNPDQFDGPLDAYLQGSDHMRRWLYSCRRLGLFPPGCKWCWKLEFQANGWPHWHVLVERKTKFTQDEMRSIAKTWGIGRTNTKRVNQKQFRYDFKYAFKSVEIHSEGSDSVVSTMAPAWFLDYKSKKNIVVDGQEIEKSVTFSRARFWQTSRGFYTGIPPVVIPPSCPQSSLLPRTVRQVLEGRRNTVRIFARKTNGDYIRSSTVTLKTPINHFWNIIGFDADGQHAVGFGSFSFVIQSHRLNTNPTTQCQIQHLLRENRLSVPRARHLRSLKSLPAYF